MGNSAGDRGLKKSRIVGDVTTYETHAEQKVTKRNLRLTPPPKPPQKCTFLVQFLDYIFLF